MGSQCGTPPSGSGFSHLKVKSHSSPDRFTGQRSLGESTSGEFVDKSTGHRRDRTGQKSLTKSTEPDRTGPNWVSISRRVHRSRDRIGPDRTGCQSPEESTGHVTVELSTGQRTLD